MIKRIKWKNYQALGNLELDFCKADGTPYSTIILAGDNGTGKTTILDTLSTFLSLYSMLPFDFIEYGIGSETYRITPDERNGNIGFHHRIKLSDGKSKEVSTSRDNRFEQLQSDTEDIRYYGVAYSKARTGFKTKKIQSSTTEQMDREKYENDSTDVYSRIKQLLVDLSGQDNSDLISLCESENGVAEGRFQQFKQTSRMYRFSKAFDDFFDGLKYDKIDESNPDEKKISFIKHGKRIAIDSLSTGEHKIVFCLPWNTPVTQQ